MALLLGPCDASGLLKNAADIGDCSDHLEPLSSCTNTGVEGFTCSASYCGTHELEPGYCSDGTAVNVRAAGGVEIESGVPFVPEVQFEDSFYPICGHQFEFNFNGATLVCQQLGFKCVN